MEATQEYQSFIGFLEEYSAFLSTVVEAQNDKIEALLTHDVEVIEQSVTKQQAVAMQLKQYEETRMKRQKAAGLDGLSLGEIIERASGREQQRIRSAFGRMEDSINQIKFLNNKALQMVETNLHIINLTAPQDERLETQGYTEDGKQSAAQGKAPLFETKI